MKKVTVLLFLMISSLIFPVTKNYKVIVEPTFSMSETDKKTNNDKIENKIKQEFSSEKITSIVSGQMQSFFENNDDTIKNNPELKKMLQKQKEFTEDMFKTIFKYTKIEIDEINYVSQNKAYVTVKLQMPDTMSSFNQEKMQKEMMSKMMEIFKDVDKNSKNAKIEDIQDKMYGIMKDYIGKELEKTAKENKYIVSKYIVKLEKKGNEWETKENLFEWKKNY